MRLLIIALFVIGCKGQPGDKGDKGDAGASCTVEDTYYGSKVTCPDGSTQEIYDGQNGSDGTNGTPGADGHSIVIAMTSSTSCANGGQTLTTATDMDDSGSITVGDTNIQSADICNGEDGEPAPATPFTPTGIMDPCGDSSGVWDEVLLKLSNGTILASFSDNANGLNTRFSVLQPGSYRTTDGSGCYFSVDSSGNLYNEHF